MNYQPKAGDKIRLTNSARGMFIYRIDQVIFTDEGQILGVVISVLIGHKRRQHFYDLVTFESFGPVKVKDSGQVESETEA